MMQKKWIGLLLWAAMSFAQAAEYKLDIKGQHAFINFKVKHLGYSWLYGRFNEFDGQFTYDEKAPEKAKIAIDIMTGSVDSNHEARDRHLRSDDFLNADKHPKARFVSTSYQESADGSGELKGQLTLNGVTREVMIKTQKIGQGSDPWGGYRVGFEGSTSFALKDFNIKKSLGPASTHVYLDLHIEGIRQ